jgi:hypothetical protein
VALAMAVISEVEVAILGAEVVISGVVDFNL